MLVEQQRLDFLIDRDGMEGALEFARRTMVSYRRYVLDRKRCVRELRPIFIKSYLDFKRFIEENG